MKTIAVKNLCKNYGKKFSLVDINLDVNEKEFVALLGENGAGKTTLLKLISGLLKPLRGEILILGNNIRNLKHLTGFLGVVSQYTGLPDLLKVKEFLRLEARLRNLNEKVIIEGLELAGLQAYANTKICDLSEGSKRKIVIIKALLHRPKILLLDEPTVGLDPFVRNEIWEHLLNIKKTGVSAIVSTNYLYEAEYLCKRIVFIMQGKIIADTTIDEFKKQSGKDSLESAMLHFLKRVDRKQDSTQDLQTKL